MKINKQSQTPKRIFIVTCVVVILAAIGYLIYAKNTDLGPFPRASHETQNDTASSSSASITPPKDTADLSDDNEERVKNGGGTGQDESPTAGSGIVDTRGEDVNDESNGVTSPSGDITLFNPTSGQKLVNGMTIKGLANVPIVYYRISDNINGMISNGQLRVKDGKYSGTIAITTNASEGKFEVYSFNTQGQEINNIGIKVSY